jgi:hypothetical protein
MARRKHLARGGIHVRRGDVTPPDAIRRDELVEEIVDHLRPWKDRKGAAAVTAEVNRALDVLLKLVPLEAKLSDRTRNRTHALQLDSCQRFNDAGSSHPIPTSTSTGLT